MSTQDITPYANGLYHINSILQPAVARRSPVVGVALTTETASWPSESRSRSGLGVASFLTARWFLPWEDATYVDRAADDVGSRASRCSPSRCSSSPATS
ncbi:DUF1177 family protein [Georgenia sp. SUBG003]|uniref:DUF1177 family protein n=1 Tax=Georgenia sp. SUBG003 TaxID=1497974 RepID=UPI003AB52EC9